jgi:hypothetical protein
MGRMSELAQELAELKRCGEILIGISESLTEMFSAADEPVKDEAAAEPVKENPKKAKEPAAKKVIKLADVRAVLAEKSRAGFTKEVKELLIKHGADKLSGIDASEYEALLAEVEVLGNG